MIGTCFSRCIAPIVPLTSSEACVLHNRQCESTLGVNALVKVPIATGLVPVVTHSHINIIVNNAHQALLKGLVI